MEFCKAFNAQSQTPDRQGKPLPVEITVYEDRSFTFIIKTPPASHLIKEAAGIGKGSSVPHTTKVGKITLKQVEEIAKVNSPDSPSLPESRKTIYALKSSMQKLQDNYVLGNETSV